MANWKLYIGTKPTNITAQPDPKWPSMWCIHSPNGRVSDMANLVRAKDAAVDHAITLGNPSTRRDHKWIKIGAEAPAEPADAPKPK